MGFIVIVAVLAGFALGWVYRSRLTSRRVSDVGGVPSPIADRDDDDVHLVASDYVCSTSSMRARMPSDPAIMPRLARGSMPPPARSVVGELVIPDPRSPTEPAFSDAGPSYLRSDTLRD